MYKCVWVLLRNPEAGVKCLPWLFSTLSSKTEARCVALASLKLLHRRCWLEHRDPPASTSPRLGLKVCAGTPFPPYSFETRSPDEGAANWTRVDHGGPPGCAAPPSAAAVASNTICGIFSGDAQDSDSALMCTQQAHY